VLLEIFDFYRQGIHLYYHQWRKSHVWIDLAQVCRKWRAVLFASYSRLDLGATMGPMRPLHIKTILSGPLPIFIDYRLKTREITGSPHWRLRNTLKHRDRVREIAFQGCSSTDFDKFFKETNCAFPALESIYLRFPMDYGQKLPDTFLGGPDRSYLHLRSLKLERVSLASISEVLLSATALTDLSLQIDTVFGSSPETSLLTCLNGMPCLRHLSLYTSYIFLDFPLQPSTPKDIVPLSKLTSFRYVGHIVYLEALVAGLSTPSLRSVDIEFPIEPPIVHVPRFINEIEEHYHAVHVNLHKWLFRFTLLTNAECIVDCKPRFKRESPYPELLMEMAGALSTRLSTVEELRVTFDGADAIVWENFIPWRRFLLQFPGVKTLRTEGADNCCFARILLQDHEWPDDVLTSLPALEEIQLGESLPESQRGPELAAFEPLVSVRQQAGRPVKVFFDL
jgi:hypothetical protein